MGFDDMLAIGGNLGDREPREFWVEVRHNANLRYLPNKTNAISQSMRSTTALVMELDYDDDGDFDDYFEDELKNGITQQEGRVYLRHNIYNMARRKHKKYIQKLAFEYIKVNI
ncbi:hypothetical protein RhiirB3_437540 [Rhizophagus irregularis]|nr:hypothetical protein RhiirB3_437540 [Rhizophagus irregularis]